MDGWLPTAGKIIVASATEYRSVQYARFNMHVQAMCDTNLRFIFFSITTSGKTNDTRSFSMLVNFRRWFGSLGGDYFIGWNNTYPISNYILISFRCDDILNHQKSVYNVSFSQLHIVIEISFVRLNTK